MIRLALSLALLLGLAGAARAQSYTCGGALVPSWVTANRPTGAVNDQTTGYNLTTGQCETYSAATGQWSNGSSVVSFNTRGGAVSLLAADVTGALGYTPVNKAGDTMSGALTLGAGGTVNNSSTLTFASGSKLLINASSGVTTTLVNTGNLMSGSFALSGSSQPALGTDTPLALKSILTGSLSNANDFDAYQMQINTDSLAMTGGGGVNGLEIYDILGTSWSGSRRALDITLTAGNAVTLTGATFLTGIRTTVSGNANLGGTSGTPIGDLFGFNPNVFAAASYLSSVNGIEIGLAQESGATGLATKVGVAVDMNGLNVLQATNLDSAFEISMSNANISASTVGLKTYFSLGKQNGGWALSSTGAILAPYPQTVVNAGGVQTVPMAAAFGMDFWDVNFSTAAWRSTGTYIDGNGDHFIGTGEIQPVAGGIQISAPGEVASIASIASAGNLYQVGDALYDRLGGIINVDTVNGGGQIQTWHYLHAPYAFGTYPSSVSALSGGSGDFTAGVNLTWTAAATVSLLGEIAINSATALSLSATVGFVDLPTTSGIPTGTPGVTALSHCAIDTTNGYLNCYYASAWHKIAFAAGAG